MTRSRDAGFRSQRPDDAVLEILTANGAQRFVLPKSAMHAFAEKLLAFEKGSTPNQQN